MLTFALLDDHCWWTTGDEITASVDRDLGLSFKSSLKSTIGLTSCIAGEATSRSGVSMSARVRRAPAPHVDKIMDIHM